MSIEELLRLVETLPVSTDGKRIAPGQYVWLNPHVKVRLWLDHLGIVFQFPGSETKRPRGYWSTNTSEDEPFFSSLDAAKTYHDAWKETANEGECERG